jgi:hypothetical protein
MTKNDWIVGAVGGDDVLKRFIVSRPARTGGLSAREWVMDGELVKVFDERKDAQKAADKYNKYSKF